MDRVERLIGVPAEKQTKLDDVVTLLVDAQIRTEQRFQQTDERFQVIEQRFRETDEIFRQLARRFEQSEQRMERRFKQTDQWRAELAAEDKRLAKLAAEEKERGRKLDERIDKLVSAIGEMLRRRNGGTQ